jgi:hypothetical protein
MECNEEVSHQSVLLKSVPQSRHLSQINRDKRAIVYRQSLSCSLRMHLSLSLTHSRNHILNIQLVNQVLFCTRSMRLYRMESYQQTASFISTIERAFKSFRWLRVHDVAHNANVDVTQLRRRVHQCCSYIFNQFDDFSPTASDSHRVNEIRLELSRSFNVLRIRTEPYFDS